jgi:hypothetical protein
LIETYLILLVLSSCCFTDYQDLTNSGTNVLAVYDHVGRGESLDWPGSGKIIEAYRRHPVMPGELDV